MEALATMMVPIGNPPPVSVSRLGMPEGVNNENVLMDCLVPGISGTLDFAAFFCVKQNYKRSLILTARICVIWQTNLET